VQLESGVCESWHSAQVALGRQLPFFALGGSVTREHFGQCLAIRSFFGISLLCLFAVSAQTDTGKPVLPPGKDTPGRPAPAAAIPDAVSVAFLQAKQPVAADAITTLGPEMFGDKINLFNGSFEFEVTDFELPGNNALPVALVRNQSPGRKVIVRGALADWDLNTPRVEGTFALPEGWVPDGYRKGGRCRGFSPPPYLTRGSSVPADFAPWEYWQGTNLVVPGQGSQEILARGAGSTPLPTNSGGYPLVTKSHWQIGCLATVQNAAGEGFVALSPEGVRYRFDWMASRPQVFLQKGSGSLTRSDFYLMASLVTDRFGNWVRYVYDTANPLNLLRIESSDGRSITLTYAGGRVAFATDGTRTWQYQYSTQGDLARAQLPDGSDWQYNLRPLLIPSDQYPDSNVGCDMLANVMGSAATATIKHPSGAMGTFNTNHVVQGRTNVERVCTYISGTPWTDGAVWQRSTSNLALVSKSISAPGMATMTWLYGGGSNSPYGEWAPCTVCLDRKVVTVTEPSGAVTRHTFGIMWRVNEGQLLKLEEDWVGQVATRTTAINYRSASSQNYSDSIGDSIFFGSDYLSTRNRPQDLRVISQQGVDFTWRADVTPAGFDQFARVKRVDRFSSAGPVSSLATDYHDNLNLWVLGQTLRVTELSNGLVPKAYDYSPSTALPVASYNFGRLVNSFAYNADGTLAVLYDAANRPTQFQNFTRGKPQRVVFADLSAASSTVDNLGNVTSSTNEVGSTWSFGFDAMGRVASIAYPGGDAAVYLPTLQAFEQVWSNEWGLAPGYWRQTVRTGNGVTVRWFDAMWRVRLQLRQDDTNAGGTASYVESRFDAAGRTVFESYPSRSFSVLDDPARPGKRTHYDGLDRVVRKEVDSELGPLVTSTRYLNGFRREVTNPRNFLTTYAFRTWDTPSEEQIRSIASPESTWVNIERDVFGKPNSITRGGNGISLTRHYAYDAHQRLCKTVEPESGATLQDYDAAGNIAWRATGLGFSAAGCDTGAAPSARRTSFGYDARNRLTSTSYGDGSPSVTRTYTADGLPLRVASTELTWTYGYNNRRLLTAELLSWPYQSAGQGWNFYWSVDANGNVDALTDPWGRMEYGPNALGQARQVAGYVNGVTYHPNGAVAGFGMGNGIRRDETQNVRGLPQLSRDIGVAQDRYTYDANGNVSSITDELNLSNSRSMPLFDGLDRLRQANGAWGAGTFTYDSLDNIRTSTVGGRGLIHLVDSRNRMVGFSGSQNIGMDYDANGNLSWRGGQNYSFDLGNRLRNVPGVASYGYDGNGRRHWVQRTGGSGRLWAYSQAGKLLFSWDTAAGHMRHVYLGTALVAEHTEAGAVTYVHTDALGSPTARTNVSAQVVSSTSYEPYGATAAGTNPTGIGFTGHVNDADTGLVYMQQRYYDPVAGRFLSVDPVTTNAKTGRSFNRYSYVENNPYTNIDPDGRDCVSKSGTTTCSISVTGTRIPTKISFPTPAGVSGTQSSSSATNHQYNIQTPHRKSDSSVQSSMIQSPTPGTGSSPASPTGTPNNATPEGGRGLLARAGGLFGNNPDSPVRSYSVTVGSDKWAINVTQPGHGLHFGFVLRGSINGVAMSIGEGWALPQAAPLLGPYINSVWVEQNQRNIDAAR